MYMKLNISEGTLGFTSEMILGLRVRRQALGLRVWGLRAHNAGGAYKL